MYKPPRWTIYILTLGHAGSAAEQLQRSHGASGEKMGKGLHRVKGLSQLVEIYLGRGAGLGGCPGGVTVGRTPSCCISVPAFLPPGSSVFLQLLPMLGAWWWPWGRDSDTSHLATGGGWLVGPSPNPGDAFPSGQQSWG